MSHCNKSGEGILNKFLDNNGSTIGYANFNGLGSDEISVKTLILHNSACIYTARDL